MPVGVKDSPDVLELVRRLPPDKSPAQDIAEMTAEGRVQNAYVTHAWSGFFARTELDLTELTAAIEAMAHRVADGNREDLERVLASQVVTLNTVFANLLIRAQRTDLMPHLDTYLRLALRAQNQCRATAETLAQMKMPPVFAKQANIAHGPQQVNNTVQLGGPAARAALPSSPNELLETRNGQRLDAGTTTAAGAGDLALAPVGTINRPADRDRKGQSVTERVQGRPSRDAPEPGPGARGSVPRSRPSLTLKEKVS